MMAMAFRIAVRVRGRRAGHIRVVRQLQRGLKARDFCFCVKHPSNLQNSNMSMPNWFPPSDDLHNKGGPSKAAYRNSSADDGSERIHRSGFAVAARNAKLELRLFEKTEGRRLYFRADCA
jgi:hypothetical protein